MKIGIFGTFDVENYGDLLFPLIAEHELKLRLEEVELIKFSYNAKHRPSWVYDVESLTSLLDNSIDFQALDVIMIGGGHLLRFDRHIAPQYGPPIPQISHPAGYWLAPALAGITTGRPVIWNAPGASDEFPPWGQGLLTFALENSAYVSLRDDSSFEAIRKAGFVGACKIVPDTGFGLARLFPREKLGDRVDGLLSGIGLGEKYIVIQASPLVKSAVKALSSNTDLLDTFDVLVLPIGPGLGDEVSSVLNILPQAKCLPSWPSPEEIAGIVAYSSGVIAVSLHLSITALVYGSPVLRPAAFSGGKYALLQSSENIHLYEKGNLDGILAFVKVVQSGVPRLCSLVQAAQNQLQEHWNTIAEICRKPQQYGSSSAHVFSQTNLLLMSQESSVQATAGQVQALTAQVAEINASRAWRYIQPLRRLRAWLKAKDNYQ